MAENNNDRGSKGRAEAEQTYAPRQTAREDRTPVRRARQRVKRPVSTVLVVEDDPFQRMVIATDLEEAGWRVVDAFNADEAMGILEENGDIAVLITDVHMAGDFDGLGLARLARARWPDMAVVVTSGLIMVQENQLPPGVIFLPKPAPPGKLIALMNAAVKPKKSS